MRRLFPILLLLGACSQEPEPPPVSVRAVYAGEGRDRLCLYGDRAGFITYGKGNANCAMTGRVERADGRLTFIPVGDEDCRIAATVEGDTIRLGPRTAACAFYCGPAADYSGRAFAIRANASPAVDFAGDPLC